MENHQEGSGIKDELREDTGRVKHAASERLQSEADTRKGQVAGQAHAVSSALNNAAREMGSDTPGWVKSALEQGARSIDQLAQAVEGKDSSQLAGDVQQFARQRPGSFLAGCALLGFAASRVFKAGGAHQSQTTRGTTPASHENDPLYEPYALGTAAESRPMMDFGNANAGSAPVATQSTGHTSGRLL
ncbi:hypothetical protein [Novosphingobium sp. M1R2S20]|uniref:Nutrient deprivation-induced protein n=1 Tax=Novosphingobium rhizovicinum TaxID=3228928 RepID=A0ABV3RGT2_9SPHN